MLTDSFCVCLHICLTDTSLPLSPAVSASSVAPSIIIFSLKNSHQPSTLSALAAVAIVAMGFLNLLYRLALSTEVIHSDKMQAAALQ